ncbi:MAG: helix-turn-helix domain-containing protein [Acidimicrobiales bacterium]|nr:helix-turn-helix domain-containing protein [Acidimicrobiales bacterium]
MPSEPDEAEIVLYGASYWAEHPDQLAEVLKEATGIDSPSIARRINRHDEIVHAVRLPFDFLANRILPGFLTATTPIPPTKRLTLTVEEAANALGISRTLAYEAVQRGEIPHIRIGKRILISQAQLVS